MRKEEPDQQQQREEEGDEEGLRVMRANMISKSPWLTMPLHEAPAPTNP